MTSEVIAKLEHAFAVGATDKEACFFAGISEDALYDYCNKYPQFTERKEGLKETPVLKARETVVNFLDDPNHAKWYLEKKRKAEFSSRNELTGGNNEPLIPKSEDNLTNEERAAIRNFINSKPTSKKGTSKE